MSNDKILMGRAMVLEFRGNWALVRKDYSNYV